MEDGEKIKQGRRRQKREETLKRIAEAGLQLFLKQGFEATTLEQIAEAAGISRRTFFYYFKSKEEVLLAWEGGGFVDALRPALLAEGSDREPFDAVQHCLVGLAARYETPQSIQVDRLLRSTETLRARKQATYAHMEEVLYEALSELWPGSERRDGLRLLAMTGIGALRIAMENWRAHGGREAIADYLIAEFSALAHEASRWSRTRGGND